VLDVCAGNLRNRDFLHQHGFRVVAVDQTLPGAEGSHLIEHDLRKGLPRQLLQNPPAEGPFGLVLLQYCLMFFTDKHVRQLLNEVIHVTADGALIVIEMQDIKSRVWCADGWPLHKKADPLCRKAVHYIRMLQQEQNIGRPIKYKWSYIHRTKWRCILRKEDMAGGSR